MDSVNELKLKPPGAAIESAAFADDSQETLDLLLKAFSDDRVNGTVKVRSANGACFDLNGSIGADALGRLLGSQQQVSASSGAIALFWACLAIAIVSPIVFSLFSDSNHGRPTTAIPVQCR